MDNLYKLLDYYESIIDVEHFYKTVELQKKIMQFEEPDHIGMRLMYPSDTFKRYTMQEIHDDMAKMMYNELLDCLPQIEAKDSGIPMLRANFGVGALPSAFGLKSYIIENNMPWVEHVSKDEAKKFLIMACLTILQVTVNAFLKFTSFIKRYFQSTPNVMK